MGPLSEGDSFPLSSIILLHLQQEFLVAHFSIGGNLQNSGQIIGHDMVSCGIGSVDNPSWDNIPNVLKDQSAGKG